MRKLFLVRLCTRLKTFATKPKFFLVHLCTRLKTFATMRKLFSRALMHSIKNLCERKGTTFF